MSGNHGVAWILVGSEIFVGILVGFEFGFGFEIFVGGFGFGFGYVDGHGRLHLEIANGFESPHNRATYHY
jgi:hypothetical protein